MKHPHFLGTQHVAVGFVILGIALVLVLESSLFPSALVRPSDVGATGHAGDPATATTDTVPVGVWTSLTATAGTPPPARYAYAMAYDPDLGETILFGGRNAAADPMGDTWEFSYGTWRNLTPLLSLSPSPRAGAEMVYDPALGSLLLYGGHYDGYGLEYNDTWTFGANGWVQLHPSANPGDRGTTEMVYDSTDGYVLLWELNVSSIPQNYWKFQGGTWTNITSTVTGGLPNLAIIGSDDPQSGGVLFYGGFNQCTGGLGLTYTYSGGVFSNLSSSEGSSPAAADGSAVMTYDPASGGVLLFSGYSASCELTNQTWLFRSGSWIDLTSLVGPPPPGRWDARLAYNPQSGEAVTFSGNEALIGGVNSLGQDTWEYGIPLRTNASVTPVAGIAPLTVRLAANPTGGGETHWVNWSFSDGSANSTTGNGTHTFQSAGNYSVNFTVEDVSGRLAHAYFVVYVLSSSLQPPLLTWFALGIGLGASVTAVIAAIFVAVTRRRRQPPVSSFAGAGTPPTQ